MERGKQNNPWLHIPHNDYEAHMSDPKVGQLQVLSKIFGECLERYSPKSLAVLGCSGGNGFEHLKGKEYERIIAIDINPDYLALCKARYASSISNLEFVCADLNNLDFTQNSLEYIHAALIFEYVEMEGLMKKTASWLKRDGVLCCVLQMPSSRSAPVSETKFESVKQLSSFINLIEPDRLTKEAAKNNLVEIESGFVELLHGKKFLARFFRKELLS